MIDQRVHILTGYLVLRVQGGEPEALCELVNLWTDRLHARARRLIGDDAAAGDITQEAWIGIARGIRRLRDPNRFGTWAMRIVHHKCADAIRANIRNREMLRSQSRPDQDRSVPPADRSEIREAICLLPPKYREVIMLFYMDDCSVETIALVLGAPVGTVKSRLRRAREQLRTTLERNQSNG